jgi:hypothetical protein
MTLYHETTTVKATRPLLRAAPDSADVSYDVFLPQRNHPLTRRIPWLAGYPELVNRPGLPGSVGVMACQ